MSSFDLQIMISCQQMQVTGQMYRILHQAEQLQR